VGSSGWNYINNYDVSGPFTISLWVYPESGGSTNQGLLINGEWSSLVWVTYFIGLRSNRLKFQGYGAAEAGFSIYPTQTLGTGAWHHVVGTFDGTTINNLVVNGAFASDVSWTDWLNGSSGGTVVITGGQLKITQGSNSVWMGAYQSGINLIAGKEYTFKGKFTGSYGRVYIGTSAGNAAYFNPGNFSTGVHKWTFIASATTADAYMTLQDGQGATSIGYWEDVSLSETASDGARLYVDGVLYGSDPSTAASVTYTGKRGGIYLGSDYSNNTAYFTGKMGAVQFYKGALTAQQVKESFNQQSSRFNVPNWRNRDIVQSGLIRWLDFGEAACYPGGAIGTVNDLKTGTAYTVSNSGGGITYSGEGGGCFAFAGTTDDKIPFTWTGGLPACTVSVWVYNLSGGDTRQTLFGHYFEIDGTYERLQMYSYGFSNLGWRFSSVGSVPYDTWTNAVMTWDGSNVKAYINGALNYTNTVGAGGDAGAFYEISVSWARLKAKLATALIYDRALSASELEQNFIVQRQRFGV
jgi:hypothetical protein